MFKTDCKVCTERNILGILKKKKKNLCYSSYYDVMNIIVCENYATVALINEGHVLACSVTIRTSLQSLDRPEYLLHLLCDEYA